MTDQNFENEHPRGRDGKFTDKPGTGVAAEGEPGDLGMHDDIVGACNVCEAQLTASNVADGYCPKCAVNRELYGDDDVAGVCPECDADLTWEQVTDGYCPHCDGGEPVTVESDLHMSNAQAQDFLADLKKDLFLNPVPDVNLKESSTRGMWELEDPDVTTETTESGFTRIKISTWGNPDRRARTNAAANVYAQLADRETVNAKMDDLIRKGKPMTVLVRGDRGDITAREVKGGMYGGQAVLYPKGTSKRYWPLERLDIVDVSAGYGGQEDLAETWNRRTAQFIPQVSKIENFDDVPLQGHSRGMADVSAAYLISHPGFGEAPAHGCMFLAMSRDTDTGQFPDPKDAPIYGYFYAPQDSGVYGEFGSFTQDQLRSWGGRIDGFEPGSMTAEQAMDLPADDVTLAYRKVMGRDN